MALYLAFYTYLRVATDHDPSMASSSYLHLLVVLHIDNRFLPLASRDFALEQDVNLAVGSTLHLRQVEVCRDQAKKTGGTPNVATLSAKVSTLQYVSKCPCKILRKMCPTVGLSI